MTTDRERYEVEQRLRAAEKQFRIATTRARNLERLPIGHELQRRAKAALARAEAALAEARQKAEETT